MTLYQYNDVLFPENHYYNSDALPIEWMEIFETKETLKELEQDSLITDIFTQSVDQEQIDMTEEPRSFLNKIILGSEFPHPNMSKSNLKNFIHENKIKVKKKSESNISSQNIPK